MTKLLKTTMLQPCMSSSLQKCLSIPLFITVKIVFLAAKSLKIKNCGKMGSVEEERGESMTKRHSVYSEKPHSHGLFSLHGPSSRLGGRVVEVLAVFLGGVELRIIQVERLVDPVAYSPDEDAEEELAHDQLLSRSFHRPESVRLVRSSRAPGCGNVSFAGAFQTRHPAIRGILYSAMFAVRTRRRVGPA